MSEKRPSLKRAAEILEQALSCQDSVRQRYLDDACGHDPDLRGEVESLLSIRDQQGDFLGSPTFDEVSPQVGADPTSTLAVQEGVGTRIGPYKLLQRMGEGGFGAVYMAEQETPVRRKVALKIIKLGMDTKQVIARFEAERQALAMMDHANIARVLDAGATESGRPYFVMELVHGVSITRFCDENRFSVKQRLELFAEVCHAVQHAHTKGIIHRDLKPSNVMVTISDPPNLPLSKGGPEGVGVPKVIDFGIAKATGAAGRLTDKTLFTEYHQFIGTPEYMSPEQAQMNAIDIDTRSDIYSLGVLLYELLTGVTPFDREKLRGSSLDEVRRIIREEEPPKPSTRLEQGTKPRRHEGTKADDTGASPLRGSLARSRSCLGRGNLRGCSLRGELDWIVMKCLEKDRTRRYETANGLAADVQHYLADEPVSAGPPSRLYRLRKNLSRHRVAVMIAVCFLGLIAAALLVSTTFWRQSEVARRSEEAYSKVLLNLLQIQSPERMGVDSLEMERQRLNEAAAELKSNSVINVPSKINLWSTIGSSFVAIDAPMQGKECFLAALQLCEHELDPCDPLHWTTLRDFAAGYFFQIGDLKSAAEYHDRAVAAASACLPEGDYEVEQLRLQRLSYLIRQNRVDEAWPEIEKLLITANPDLEIAEYLKHIGDVLHEQNDPVRAEPLKRRALEIARIHAAPSLDHYLNSLGATLDELYQWEEAESLLRECIALREAVDPEDRWRPYLYIAMGELGDVLGKQGRFEEAEFYILERADHIDEFLATKFWQEWKREFLLRTVEFYEAWDKAEPGRGHGESANQWRAKLNLMD